jgi:type II secretory pathway pseudopilin PulG
MLRDALRDQSGLGLVEIVIAFAILAIVSLSLIPVLANGISQSASNTTIATASQLANAQINLAAIQPTTCSHFNDYGILTQTTSVDARGVTLVVTNTVAVCPTGYPSSRVFTTTVTRQSNGATLATASTRVLVTGS